jgi:hypothetical protein
LSLVDATRERPAPSGRGPLVQASAVSVKSARTIGKIVVEEFP